MRASTKVPTQDGHGRKLADVRGLAEYLGRDTRAIYRLVSDHDLPAYKLGRALVFDLDAVDAWLAEHRVGRWPQNGHGGA